MNFGVRAVFSCHLVGHGVATQVIRTKHMILYLLNYLAHSALGILSFLAIVSLCGSSWSATIQAGLELKIFLFQPPECWDQKQALLYLPMSSF